MFFFYYLYGVHYLFYLHKTAGTVWDGMSVAKSEDGVHYQEIGPIIHKREDVNWLGTGSIWQVDDRYVLIFLKKEKENKLFTLPNQRI